MALEHRWSKCITLEGKYIEKEEVLQQDNGRVHTCKVAMDVVERNGYEVVPHPAYSPDLP